MQKYHLAEINITNITGVSLEDPIMKELVDNIDSVNTLAESSAGFIWRLKDENNNASSMNLYNDEQIIINVSVWETKATFENFVYKTFHSDFLRKRKDWFLQFGKAHTAMRWIEAGQVPTMEEALNRLNFLQKNGASEFAFDFKNFVWMPT